MTRAIGLALALAALGFGLGGCGKYGPPVRYKPPAAAPATPTPAPATPAPTQETPAPSDDDSQQQGTKP